MRKSIFPLLFFIVSKIQAQDTSKAIVYSGYVETFYAFEFNKPLNNKRPAFLYSHNRHNEFNINLAYLKAAFADKKVRANLALASGTYMLDNYANEPAVLKNILEANVGIQLTEKIGLDVGIMPSHIGFESAVSKDCWTLTRSLLAENSPYFETGAKVTFIPDEKWTVSLLVLNGWQRISRINSTPSVGSQILWKTTDKVTLNWSTFYGNDRPDSVKQMRFFNDFYGIFQINEKTSLIAGFDIGAEAAVQNGDKRAIWYSPILIFKYQVNEKWALAGRYENYTDKNGVIVMNDFKTNGYSLNVDYAPVSNALLRFEARLLDGKNNIFSSNSTLKNSNFYLTSSLVVGF
jgi:hypothetical protein